MKIIIYDIEIKNIGKVEPVLVQECDASLSDKELQEIIDQIINDFEESINTSVDYYRWRTETI